MFDWTEDRISELKRLWTEGWTGERIAAWLGGVTRNAVIGKVHRLKLQPRERSGRPRAAPRRPPRARTTVTLSRPKVVTIDPPEAPPPVEIWEPAPAPTGNLTVLDLDQYTCRWPIGHVGQPEFTFCGARPKTGLPYCPAHARMAYVAPQRRAVR